MISRALVTVERHGALALLTIDNPPVNALGHSTRSALLAAISHLDDVDAVLIRCAGRSFIAGADITEFGQPEVEPSFQDLIDVIEAVTVPTVAVMHGNVLGGGLELAMACTHRAAVRGTRFGLPEINLGIVPGAGGTQRAPRLVGPEKALDMILSGIPISVEDALQSGLIDAVVDDTDAAAVAFARSLIAKKTPVLRTRDRSDKLSPWVGEKDIFASARARAQAKPGTLAATFKAIDLVEAANKLPFDDGIAFERKTAREIVDHPEAVALRYCFFSERKAAKVPGVPVIHLPAKASTAAVVGAGNMGADITTALLNAGMRVVLIDQSEASVNAARGRIAAYWEARAASGRLSDDDVAARKNALSVSADLSAAGDAGLVIEAVWESMSLKREVFAKLDAIMPKGAILATNTSTLDINEIAAATKRPESVVGLHFFNPAHVMKLVEVVRGDKTAPETIGFALALTKKLGKTPVVVGVCDGFVGNRLFKARDVEAVRMLVEGASPQQIDAAIRGFGFPMGPFELYDMSGAIELGWRMRQESGEQDPVADRLFEQGRLGSRVSRGYYRYEAKSRTPIPDPAVDAIIADVRAEQGIDKRYINEPEIVDRMIFPMINEAAKLIEEGVVVRPSDIDVVWITGYGWPRSKGGPCYYGDLYGLRRVRERLRELQVAYGGHFKTAALLETLADRDGCFRQLAEC